MLGILPPERRVGGSAVAVRAAAIWLLLLVLAFGNGAIREIVLMPRFGVLRGHQLSSLLLSGAILLLAYLSIEWIAPGSAKAAWGVGLLWLVLVLAFEFGFGLWRGTSLEVMLRDYDVASGRLWVIVLIATVVSPSVAARLRRLHTDGDPAPAGSPPFRD